MPEVSDDIYLLRRESLITQRETTELLEMFPGFPVFIGCTDEPQASDLLAEMRFDICTESGMIQVGKLLPQEIVYGGFHSEAVGALWAEHHAEFVEFCTPWIGKNVLEPGGSNGTIAELALRRTTPETWVIVEPAPPESLPDIFDGDVVIMRKGFLEDATNLDGVDTVVHSHTLEHAYEPNVYLSCAAALLAPGQKHLFSIPDLGLYLKRKYANTLNFEHTFLLDEEYCEYLLAKHGFTILEKKKFRDHSIFFATERVAEFQEPEIANRYEDNRRFFAEFVEFYRGECRRIRQEIEASDSDVFMFGAHIFTQFLVYLGVPERRVVAVLDNSSAKQGKRLYGTSLSVGSPELLRDRRSPLVVLKAGQYQDEVRRQLLEINPSCRLVE